MGIKTMSQSQRWKGIKDSTRQQLYRLANLPLSDSEGNPINERQYVSELEEEIRTYTSVGLRNRIAIEVDGALTARTVKDPGRYAPDVRTRYAPK